MRAIKYRLKYWVHACLERLGISITRTHRQPLLDLRSQCVHPLAIPYLQLNTPALIDLELQRGRGLRIFPLNQTHPYVAILSAAQRSSTPQSTITTLLRQYYAQVQPKTPAEWLGIEADRNSSLNDAPWSLSMPWDARTPTQWKTAREKYALKENAHLGKSFGIEQGWHFWGPVSEEKLAIESNRLCHLLHSIRTQGYSRHDKRDGDINAVILKHNRDWCWQVAGGEHRAAVAAALNLTTVPVRITQIIDLADIEHWPGVENGTYSQAQARSVFLSIFHGSALPQFTEWQDALYPELTES